MGWLVLAMIRPGRIGWFLQHFLGIFSAFLDRSDRWEERLLQDKLAEGTINDIRLDGPRPSEYDWIWQDIHMDILEAVDVSPEDLPILKDLKECRMKASNQTWSLRCLFRDSWFFFWAWLSRKCVSSYRLTTHRDSAMFCSHKERLTEKICAVFFWMGYCQWWKVEASPCYRCSSSENTGQKFAKKKCDGTFRLVGLKHIV